MKGNPFLDKMTKEGTSIFQQQKKQAHLWSNQSHIQEARSAVDENFETWDYLFYGLTEIVISTVKVRISFTNLKISRNIIHKSENK